MCAGCLIEGIRTGRRFEDFMAQAFEKCQERSSKGIIAVNDQYFLGRVAHDRQSTHNRCQAAERRGFGTFVPALAIPGHCALKEQGAKPPGAMPFDGDTLSKYESRGPVREELHHALAERSSVYSWTEKRVLAGGDVLGELCFAKALAGPEWESFANLKVPRSGEATGTVAADWLHLSLRRGHRLTRVRCSTYALIGYNFLPWRDSSFDPRP